MNLALITSGGDSPGMNACLAQIVKEADIKGHIVYAYKRGFIGIKEDDFIKLKTQDVQGWHKQSGTLIKTGRFPQLKEKNGKKYFVINSKKMGLTH